MSLDSDAAARRAGACARHGQPSSTMQASGSAARHAPRRLCPTSSPGIGTTCGGFLLGRMGTPAGPLSLSPPGPWRLAPGRPDAPRAHAGERAATTDLSSAPRDGAHHHPSLPGVVTLPPARSRAHATADGPGVIRSPQRLLDEAQRGVRRSPRAPTPALDTPEGSTWAQTTAAWFRAVR